MKVTEIGKFAVGAALFSPLWAAEDMLRYLGAPISKHGITKNDEGKGIFDIWKEAEKEVKDRAIEKAAIAELEAELRKAADKAGKKIADNLFGHDSRFVGLTVDGEKIL